MLLPLAVRCSVLLTPVNPNLEQFVATLALLQGGEMHFSLLKMSFNSTLISNFSNIVHGSDSEGSAKREIDLWFRPDEIANWTHTAERWIYE